MRGASVRYRYAVERLPLRARTTDGLPPGYAVQLRPGYAALVELLPGRRERIVATAPAPNRTERGWAAVELRRLAEQREAFFATGD